MLVDPDFIVSPGLDSGIFATTQRDDGTHQLVAGKWPLYLYAADAKPGDVTGQGSGDVWFAVDTGGRLIDGTGASARRVDGDGYGPATTAPPTAPHPPKPPRRWCSSPTPSSDASSPTRAGMTLYLFTPDEAGAPTCVGGCAQAWPPLLVDDVAELLAAEGIDASTLSTVEHPDGGQQLKIGKWPLYTFSGDAAPGDTTGQGSGGKWFVVGADGKSIKVDPLPDCRSATADDAGRAAARQALVAASAASSVARRRRVQRGRRRLARVTIATPSTTSGSAIRRLALTTSSYSSAPRTTAITGFT